MLKPSTLVDAMVELADTLVSGFDVTDFLTTLTGHAVGLLPIDSAGVMLADPGGQLRVLASSSDRAELLELFEIQNNSGPCLDCFRTGEAVVNHSIGRAETRWPDFTAAARESGFVAVHAIPLRYQTQVIGALNLFCTVDQKLADGEAALAQALADVATISILQQRASADSGRLTDQLHLALESRVIIEQAKGVLAEAGNLDMAAAFEALRRYSRNNNVRLAEVATAVVKRSLDANGLLDPDRQRR